MSRRDPPFQETITAYLPSIDGSGTVIPGVANICPSLASISIASLGSAGTATFDIDGVPFKTIAVVANGSNGCPLYDLELPPSGVLGVDTSFPMSVTVLYSIVDHTPGATKEAARAASYQAHLVAPKAIRTPNRFGGQVEG